MPSGRPQPLWLLLALFSFTVAGCSTHSSSCTDPGFPKSFDFAAQQTSGVVAPPVAQTREFERRIKVGPDTVSVVLRWRTSAHDSATFVHSGTVEVPAHPCGTTVTGAEMEGPINTSHNAAPKQIARFLVQWSRNRLGRSQFGSASGYVTGDGKLVLH